MRRDERAVLSSLAALLLATACDASAQQPSPTPEPEWVEIDGRTHPELVPEYALWRSAFLDLARTAREPDVQRREEYIQALSRYSLHLRVEEVRTVLEVAANVYDRVEAALRPVREDRPGPDGTFRSCYDQIPGIALAGRDELAARLTPVSMKKMRRWLAKEIAPSGTWGAWRHELPSPAPVQ